MVYVKVVWTHDHPDEPVEFYSECDKDRWEVRKVEVFRDGRLGYADSASEHLGTALGLVPMPTLEEIRMQKEFLPTDISKEEFEVVWSLAVTSSEAAPQKEDRQTDAKRSLPIRIPD